MLMFKVVISYIKFCFVNLLMKIDRTETAYRLHMNMFVNNTNSTFYNDNVQMYVTGRRQHRSTLQAPHTADSASSRACRNGRKHLWGFSSIEND